MAKYNVEIVEIDADTYKEAQEIVKSKYDESDIILYGNDPLTIKDLELCNSRCKNRER